jgi:hypothetical protein
MAKTFEPVTMGLIRSHGCRSLLVYCVSPWCNHGAPLKCDWLPDDTMLLDLPRPNSPKLQVLLRP